MYFLPFLCQQLIHPVSQIVCLRFVSDGRFLFPHISQLPEDFVMSPSITLLSRRYLIPYTIQVYAIVPFFAVFKVWILIAVCRRFSCVSFSDFIRIDIQNWTTHIFVHINSCSGYQVSPHLAPPLPISPRLQLFAMLSIDPPLPYIGLNHKAPLCCWCFWQLLEIWHSHALSCLCFQLCLFTCRI